MKVIFYPKTTPHTPVARPPDKNRWWTFPGLDSVLIKSLSLCLHFRELSMLFDKSGAGSVNKITLIYVFRLQAIYWVWLFRVKYHFNRLDKRMQLLNRFIDSEERWGAKLREKAWFICQALRWWFFGMKPKNLKYLISLIHTEWLA